MTTSAKKVIALIKPNAQQFYFINQIHRHHPLHLVIIEDKHRGIMPALKKLQAKSAIGSKFPKQPNASVRVKSRKKAQLYSQVFADDWLDLDKSIPIVYCSNVNDPEIEQLLEQEKPDLLLDHGTSIVKAPVISKAPLALNLHWGLSPYYRGTHCTEWALINWDPYNIGVTIHRLSQAIDGGEVLSQARIEINENDSVESINMKLTREGTRLTIKALVAWKAEKPLAFAEQDHSQGYLTLNRQWSRTLNQQVKDIEQNQGIKKMLATPARRDKMPIVNC